MTYLNLIKAANVFGFIEEKMKKEGTIIITIITKNGAQIKNSITKKCKILRSLGGCSHLYIVSGTASATFLKEHYDSINSGGYFLNCSSVHMYTQIFLDWRHLVHITREAKKDIAPNS